MDTLTTAYTLNWHLQLRKDDAEATKLRDTTDKIITNRQNPTISFFFFNFNKERGRPRLCQSNPVATPSEQ